MTAKKTRFLSKRVLIAVVLLLVMGAIIGLGLYQNFSPTRQHTVDEYFDVTVGIEPWSGDKSLNNGSVIIIHAIVVTVKAVEGDAHGVIVQSWAKSDNIVLGDIPKGESRRDYMVSSDGARFTKQADGMFSINLRIQSVEATGTITVDFR